MMDSPWGNAPIYNQDALDRTWTDKGQYPPWRRVIAAGKDVTDLPVSEWPEWDQKRYAEGWRPWTELPPTRK